MNERDEQMREVLPEIARERAREREQGDEDASRDDLSTAEIASAGSHGADDDDRAGESQREARTATATATATEEPRATADMAQPREAAPGSGETGERAAVGPGAGQASAEDTRTALFTEDDASDYQARWQEIQADFVDDPRQAVEQGDALVAELMQRLAETFAKERAGLERQWDSGDEVSTEDLRLALQRYRSFFGRLLSI